MYHAIPHSQPLLLLSLLLIFTSHFCPHTPATASAVPVPGSAGGATKANTNPFTPRASLLRYWTNHVNSSVPIPSFLLSKASPLTAVNAAAYSKLASCGSLSSHLPSFCASAGLLCFPDLKAARPSSRGRDANFASYLNQNFTNYGTDKLGSRDSFKNYSNNDNVIVDTFRRYGRNSVGLERIAPLGPTSWTRGLALTAAGPPAGRAGSTATTTRSMSRELTLTVIARKGTTRTISLDHTWLTPMPATKDSQVIGRTETVSRTISIATRPTPTWLGRRWEL